MTYETIIFALALVCGPLNDTSKECYNKVSLCLEKREHVIQPSDILPSPHGRKLYDCVKLAAQ